VTLNWQSEKIRLIWVDAPESYDTRHWYTECFWTASSNYLTNLLSNKTIWLEYDSTQWMYDKYGRILAYIFLNW
jgi:endonuclease YncB( thermonuclease family)